MKGLHGFQIALAMFTNCESPFVNFCLAKSGGRLLYSLRKFHQPERNLLVRSTLREERGYYPNVGRSTIAKILKLLKDACHVLPLLNMEDIEEFFEFGLSQGKKMVSVGHRKADFSVGPILKKISIFKAG